MNSNYGTLSSDSESVNIQIPHIRRNIVPRPQTVFKFIVVLLGIGFITLFTTTLLSDIGSKNFNLQNGNILMATPPPPESSTSSSRRRVTARTPLGNLRGLTLISRAGRDYFAFYNVPYGLPPTEEFRFKPPRPIIESWNGTRDAREKGTKCIQPNKRNNSIVEGIEDCLHSNIYTPTVPGRFRNRNPNMPVLVYFFGGGFMHGTANDFLADYFMDEDCVIVVVESRVGALGFLNTEDLESTGNMGLKDQSLCLQWVQENIASFGGDPTRVVIFGTSSGAMLAHGHLLSPMSAGKMAGVMSLSGTLLNGELRPLYEPGYQRNLAQSLGRSLNCSNLDNSTELMDCLKTAPAEEIILAQQTTGWGPSVETLPEPEEFENEDNSTETRTNLTNVFLPDTPWNLLSSGRVNNVPFITGVNSAEHIINSFSLLLNDTEVSLINNDTNYMTQLLNLNFASDPNKTEEYDGLIRDFYFSGEEIGNETRFNLTDLFSDRSYIHPAQTASLLQAQVSPVYVYYLTKEANVTFAEPVTQFFDPPYGVSHADEVQYFFPRPGYPYIPLDWTEYANFSQMMVKTWVSFAETGAPVGEMVDWPQIDLNSTQILWYNFDDEQTLVEPFTERMNFWDQFPPDELYDRMSEF